MEIPSYAAMGPSLGSNIAMHEWPIDHIGIAVRTLDDALPLWESLTASKGSDPEVLSDQGVRVVFVGQTELIEATREDSPIARYLERHRSGIHHVAYRVPSIEAALQRLIQEGHTPVDRAPRAGARGHRVAFLHPKDTGGVLIELVEDGTHA